MNLRKELRYRMLLDRVKILRGIRNGLVCFRWASGAGCAPFPPAVKRAFLLDLAQKYELNLLVETGTYFGDTSIELAHRFQRVYTVEAARELFDFVAPRFAKTKNVHRLYGDSGSIMSTILSKLDGPALFWLDAHVQGFSQNGELNPILREVQAICSDGRFNHVLAIDDMRLFGRDPNYPSLHELRALISETGRAHQFATAADIGVICFESVNQACHV